MSALYVEFILGFFVVVVIVSGFFLDHTRQCSWYYIYLSAVGLFQQCSGDHVVPGIKPRTSACEACAPAHCGIFLTSFCCCFYVLFQCPLPPQRENVDFF